MVSPNHMLSQDNNTLKQELDKHILVRMTKMKRKRRRCSNDAHRRSPKWCWSAKTQLAPPNGPRPLCHLPLSSTDRHGRLVDYHQDCQDDDDM